MPDSRQRLIRCFQAVFPDLTDADAPRASIHRVAAWDSVAQVTLAAVVEEEFGFQFAVEELEKLDSFDAFLSRLDR